MAGLAIVNAGARMKVAASRLSPRRMETKSRKGGRSRSYCQLGESND